MEIYLNFLPLVNQDFQIPIFTKECSDGSLENADDEFRYKLGEGEHRKFFDVSFSEKEGFNTSHIGAFENLNITKQFILNKLIERLEHGELKDWRKPKKTFSREVDFIVDMHKEGETLVCLSPYYLSAKKQFGFIVQHRFKAAQGQIFNREVQRLSLSLDAKYRQNRFFYGDKFRITNNFISKFLPKFKNLTEGVEISSELSSISSTTLDIKKYIVGNGRVANSQYMGIKNNGPFERVNGEVKFLFAFPENLRHLARDVYLGLYGKLFHGMFPGLNDMFGVHISKHNVTHHVIPDFDTNGIDTIDAVAKQLQGAENNNVIVLAFLPSSLSEEENKKVYSHIKYNAIQSGYLSQSIRQETMGNKEQLKWSIANIGLQVFCKLGGTPWLLEPKNKNCLIFGIGSAHDKNPDGSIKKYTAYSVCLDTQGRFYRVQPLSMSENKGDYLTSLKSELVQTIVNQQNAGINECVIHVPYEISRDEIEAIEGAVRSAEGNIQFAVTVLKVNTKHKYFGFSAHNTKIPYESTLVNLGGSEYLLWTEGLQFGKEAVNRRVSEPLHIQFLYRSGDDWRDDGPYLQDILNLTGANWRGFNSKAQPISVYYSTLIARFMKRFIKYDGLSDLSLINNEAVKPWFL